MAFDGVRLFSPTPPLHRPMTEIHVTADVEADGFAVAPDLIDDELRRELIALFDGIDGQAGTRDGLTLDPVRAALRADGVRVLVRALLGDAAFAVKATLFDKSPETNWLVPWHQDVTIPVLQRRDVPGFASWSTKDGVPHVRPPAHVLESMVALRLDLDGSCAENGPLRVLAGSHGDGVLTRERIDEERRTRSEVTCLVPTGGALVMRPLLLHASSKATSRDHRRIVHVELACEPLPSGLEWRERCALA